jgi:hypothetical protein
VAGVTLSPVALGCQLLVGVVDIEASDASPEHAGTDASDHGGRYVDGGRDVDAARTDDSDARVDAKDAHRGEADVNPGEGATGDAPKETGDAPPPPALARVQALGPGFVMAASTMLMLDENAGDLLVAAVYYNESTVNIMVDDSLGNTWKFAPVYANTASCAGGGSGNADVAQIFYAESIAAGHNVVTVTQSSGTAPMGVFLVEYSGLLASGAFDGANGGPAPTSTATMTAGVLTTTGTLDLVVALFVDGSGTGLMTSGPGFSTEATDTSFYSLFEDNLPGNTPGPVNPSANEPGLIATACWVAAAAAFKGK